MSSNHHTYVYSTFWSKPVENRPAFNISPALPLYQQVWPFSHDVYVCVLTHVHAYLRMRSMVWKSSMRFSCYNELIEGKVQHMISCEPGENIQSSNMSKQHGKRERFNSYYSCDSANSASTKWKILPFSFFPTKTGKSRKDHNPWLRLMIA